MPCSCITYNHLLYTTLPPLPCLAQYLISKSLTCHFYFMICSILFCLLFEFHFSFILYPICILILVPIFLFFPHSSHEEYMLEAEESLYLVSNLTNWPTYEMTRKMHWQLGFYVWLLYLSLILYIFSLPTKLWGRLIR